MDCQLKEIGKRFNNFTIFSNVSTNLESGKKYVILGGNGSGKSTLLKIIAGGVSASEGIISYALNNQEIKEEQLPKHIGFCAPYMDIVEEFTFEEIIAFQQKFKPFQEGLSSDKIISISQLKNIDNKPIRYYSSGMKQRVKLTLSVLSNSPFLLLDEPTSNLDPKGKIWYRELLQKYAQEKTIVVGSNFLEEEYPESPQFIELANYKR